MVVVKLIDYVFQHEFQLTEAHDDSNSMRYLSSEISAFLVGRLGDISEIKIVSNIYYKTVFFPKDFTWEAIGRYILEEIHADVIHFHGNHSWPSFQLLAYYFRTKKPWIKLIFSPAGSSCGTPNFIKLFDKIIVNHPLQVERIKAYPEDISKIAVRRRTADPRVFHPVPTEMILYDFVYVAGFVPVKQIEVLVSAFLSSSQNRTLAVVGDSNRDLSYSQKLHAFVSEKNSTLPRAGKINLIEFLPQREFVKFLSSCGVFVWPNIKPENPSTTTNRAVIEALACGLPLLLGERAFKETEFVIEGFNGFTYSSDEDFLDKSEHIFNNLAFFKKNSLKLYMKNFSFEENFVSFYNNLYLS